MHQAARYTPRRSFRITTPPAAEPLTAAEARVELGLTENDDARLARLIGAARQLAEAFTGRALVTQTITFQMDAFPPPEVPWWDGVRVGSIRAFAGGAPIALPRPPLQSVTSVTYLDLSGTERTMDPTHYRVDTLAEPGRIILVPGRSWPSDAEAFANVTVRYVAGYGGPEDVPLAFVEAILAHIRETLEQPNVNATSRNIDNVTTAFAGTALGARDALAGGGGLRAGAAGLLAPYRLLELGA